MFRVVSVQCWVGALVLVALVVAPAAASEIAFDSDASTVYTGDGSATLTLERSGDTTGEVAVRMRIAGGTAQVDVDYVGRPATSDDSFDPGSGASAQLTTLAVQDDGKIVIGGTQFFNYDGVSCPRLARIMPDGSLDTTFTPHAPNNTVRAIALQADGKIVIAGNFDTVGGVTRRRVARLNANGTLDQLRRQSRPEPPRGLGRARSTRRQDRDRAPHRHAL